MILTKRFLLAMVTFFLFLAIPAPAAGRETTKYVITVVSIELKNVTGEWKTLIRPDKRIDLTEAETMFSLFNNGQIPPGNYINFRITLSETITFAGRDKNNLTRQGGELWLKGSASKASELPGEILEIQEIRSTWNEESIGDVIQHFNFDNGDADDVMTIYGKRDIVTPLEIKKGSFVKVWFDLDLEDAVLYAWPRAFGALPANKIMYTLPPSKVSELVITVGQREESVSPEAVVFEF